MTASKLGLSTYATPAECRRPQIRPGGRRAAAIYALIETANLNDIDPQAWLADVLARLPDHPAKRIDQLLPWNWRPQNLAAQAA